jgi:hypothetical protein
MFRLSELELTQTIVRLYQWEDVEAEADEASNPHLRIG